MKRLERMDLTIAGETQQTYDYLAALIDSVSEEYAPLENRIFEILTFNPDSAFKYNLRNSRQAR